MAGISKAERAKRAAEAAAAAEVQAEVTTTTEVEASAEDGAIAVQPTSALIKMVRNKEQFPPPHTADVHPMEYADWKAAGWTTEECK